MSDQCEYADYLRDSWVLRHNEDYLEFLVQKVWRLDRPCSVVEFGCGYGRVAMRLMPLLPEGSTYSGFDHSQELIQEARTLWADLPHQAEFTVAEAPQAPYDDSMFDVALCHTVLQHLPDPERVIAEMVRVTRDGGLVITCDANRNAHNAMFHIHETEEQDSTPLQLIQTMHREIRRREGLDHSIGIKLPVLLHQAGLRNVQARVTDSVRLLFPPIDTEEKRRLHQAMCREGLAAPPTEPAERAKWIARLTQNGVSEADAEREYERELARDFAANAKRYHTVWADLLTWSFGTVAKKGTP